MNKAVILMGSKADLKWAKRITNSLHKFEIKVVSRIASVQKVPLICYDIIKKQEEYSPVFITIAGMNSALSSFCDAQTHCPVIACPRIEEQFLGTDMSFGEGPATVLNPENAALAAAKILGVANKTIRAKVIGYQAAERDNLMEVNEALNGYSE